LILFLGACLLACMMLASSIPEVNGHAQKKHGQDAVDARQYVNDLNPMVRNFCSWKCPDGRTRYVCNIKGTDDWAIVIVETATDIMVSSFISNRDYAKHVIDDQCGGNKFAHP
jgi:hypothetical protein